MVLVRVTGIIDVPDRTIDGLLEDIEIRENIISHDKATKRMDKGLIKAKATATEFSHAFKHHAYNISIEELCFEEVGEKAQN